MNPIHLKSKNSIGEDLEAVFWPGKGMNLLSYKKGAIEVIDQSTQALFDERFAGLGALIGPHFHHRHTAVIPRIENEGLFPHIARVKAKGIEEPFSHGIARYAPWQILTATDSRIDATLTGKDSWEGIPLSKLEGQNFVMRMQAELTPKGLRINLSVVSDTDSLVGLHYYYHLPQGHGTVQARIQPHYLDAGLKKMLPDEWKIDTNQALHFDLDRAADYTFHPFPDPCMAEISLNTGDYYLVTAYQCAANENCWQLYHPQGASFACIEPISAYDPRHPNLSVSSIEVNLEIKDIES